MSGLKSCWYLRKNPKVKRLRNWQQRSGQPGIHGENVSWKNKQKKEIYNPGYLLHWRWLINSHTGYLLKVCSDRHNLTSLQPVTVTRVSLHHKHYQSQCKGRWCSGRGCSTQSTSVSSHHIFLVQPVSASSLGNDHFDYPFTDADR